MREKLISVQLSVIRFNQVWQVILIANYCTGLTGCYSNVRHGLLFQHKYTEASLMMVIRSLAETSKTETGILRRSRNAIGIPGLYSKFLELQ